MLKTKTIKTYYETEIVEDVFCDVCKKSLKEENEILNITIEGRCFFENRKFLDHSITTPKTKHLCRKCATPILELLELEDESF